MTQRADTRLAVAFLAISALTAGLLAQTVINPNGITPFTITSPGSYLLGSDVSMTTHNDCIRIAAHNVTLDLGGHRIRGTTAGWGLGVHQISGHGARVFNGWVASFGSGGIELLDHAVVHDVIVRENRGHGVEVESNAHIWNVTAVGNTDNGIDTLSNCLIHDCLARGNNTAGGGAGISVGIGCTVRDSVASANNPTTTGSATGIISSSGCTLVGNTASNHTAKGSGDAVGIQTVFGTTVVNNTASSNTGGPSGGNSIGILVSDDCLVMGNTCEENGGLAASTVSVGIQARHNNLIADNTCTRNDHSASGAWCFGIDAQDNNLIADNSCSENISYGSAGYAYGIQAGIGNRIEDNLCSNNWADTVPNCRGIDVTGDDNVVLANTITTQDVAIDLNNTQSWYGENVYHTSVVDAASATPGNGYRADQVIP